MAKFCSNCGVKLKINAKFCSGCGEVLKNTISLDVIGCWDAKEYDNSDDYSKRTKGSLSLSSEEIVFFKYAVISGKAKKLRTIPLAGVKSVVRTPIFNLITIKYNRKPEKTSFCSKLFNGRNVSYKINNWRTFLENIQKLKPNIKIKY